MMEKPPPITPPPVNQSYSRSEESSNVYWLLAAAVFFGLLLAMVMVPWLASLSNFGGKDGRLGNGESGTVVASLGLGSAGAAEATDPSSAIAESGTGIGDDIVPKVQAEPSETNADSTSPESQVSAAESNDENGAESMENEEEPRLLIVEQTRSVGRSIQSSVNEESIGGLGGANPFVGSGPPAKSTIYVIDVSGSMQTPDRLPRVISTLKRAVDLLESEQKFTVILFDQGFYNAPVGQGLVLANKRNKQAIYHWLANAPGGSGTNPLPAMLEAIQQRPERIVLLSDGEFDPTSAVAIMQANRSTPRSAKIDCVGLMEEVETLKEIAIANKGIYYQAQ